MPDVIHGDEWKGDKAVGYAKDNKARPIVRRTREQQQRQADDEYGKGHIDVYDWREEFIRIGNLRSDGYPI